MPRQKIDRAAVVANYVKTQNAQETARQLGIHENTVHTIVRLSRGQCARCQNPVMPGRSMCAGCLSAERDRIKHRRRQRRRDGTCIECGAPRIAGSRNYCRKHRRAANRRNAKYGTSQKLRGAPNGGTQNPRQKRRRMVARYGRSAWKRWEHIGGKCEGCAAAHGDVAIHLHHIDENQKNNAPGNHVFLCFACHRLVHLLLSSKNLPGLLDWFTKTYPTHPVR